jgi:N-acetylmuramoyl-L-alanine amidase
MGDTDEADWTLEITSRVASVFEDEMEDERYTAYCVRDVDEYVGAEQRDEFADDVEADMVLSVHFNALEADPTLHGFQPYHRRDDYMGKRFSDIIMKHIPEPLRGPSHRGMARPREVGYEGQPNWLRAANAVCQTHAPRPCVLLECGFSTNPQDLVFALSDEGKTAIVKCIVDAIIEWVEWQ